MTESKSEKSDEGRGKPYDLEERTAVFGENVIAFVQEDPASRHTAFGFRASDFLRAWVFRHSRFRAHRLV